MSNEIVTRDQAIASGAKRYFTGLPCKNGHVAERSAKNWTCFECAKEIVRRCHEKDPSIRAAKRKAAYEADKEAQKAGMREYYRTRLAADPDYNRATYRATIESRKAYSRKWAKENGDQRRAQNSTRKAAQKRAVPPWFGEFDQFVLVEAADLAVLRLKATGIAWHVDHMIPLQCRLVCGLHVAENFQVIPASMNISKNNRLIFSEPLQWVSAL